MAATPCGAAASRLRDALGRLPAAATSQPPQTERSGNQAGNARAHEPGREPACGIRKKLSGPSLAPRMRA